MSTSVQSKMMRGAGWMVLFQLLDRVLGLISTIVLVRLLSPTDFGIVAMGLAFVFMAEFLTAFGFDIVLIQHPNPTEEHYHSAWTCNVVFACAITTVLLAVAWPAAQFYRQAEVFWVLCALAFGPLLTSLENIGVVRFRKELQFRKEFTFRASRRLLAFVVTLPLAFLLRSYWALVGGILMTKLGGSVLSYMAHEFRPRFCLAKVKELFGFSKWLLISNIVSFFMGCSTDFIVGRLRGPASLGLYNISYEISRIPTADLSASINRALLPGFAKLDTDNDLHAAYGNAMGVLVLIALPAAAGVYAVTQFLVPVLLGSKWLETIALVEILAFNGAVLMILSSIGAVLIARGYLDYVTKTNVLYVLLLVGMLAILVSRYGVVGAACAALGTSVVMTPVYLYLMKRQLGVGVKVFARAIIRPALASILMALIVRWALPEYERSMSIQHAASLLVGGVALGIAVYAVTVTLLWVIAGRPVSAERLVLERIRNTVSRLLSSH
jgi:O-antigen/teichoic acid export membrane protein